MLVLQDKRSYSFGDFTISVRGLNSDELSAVIPICSAMDHKVKAKILEIANDTEMTEIIRKASAREELSTSELLKLTEFNKSNESDFSLEECVHLVAAFKSCIEKVTQKDTDVTQDFLDALPQSPKYLKLMGNLVYSEYKEATEIPVLRKN